MGLTIRRYQLDDLDAIRRLNKRFEAADVPHRFYAERPSDSGDPESHDARNTRLFVATDGNEIRGGVWLTEQAFQLNGRIQRLGWTRYPVSESLIDGAHAGVPAALLFQLLRVQPRLMALGLGGHEGVFARMLARIGWVGSTVPFYFACIRPSRVLRELSYVRQTAVSRRVADALAYSGLGWMAHRLIVSTMSAFAPTVSNGVDCEPEPLFGEWADEIWERHAGRYGFASVRTHRVLNLAYRPGSDGCTLLRVRRHGEDVGWVYVLGPNTSGDRADEHFGCLNVGVIVDCFGDPADARILMASAATWLTEANVDLIVSNQAHPAVRSALRSIGFFRGPSTFAFYRSPPVEELISTESARALGMHVTRGDCDGPRRVR